MHRDPRMMWVIGVAAVVAAIAAMWTGPDVMQLPGGLPTQSKKL